MGHYILILSVSMVYGLLSVNVVIKYTERGLIIMITLGVKRLIEQEAYKLWMKEGKPIGKDDYFWSKAEKIIWKKLTDKKNIKVEFKDAAINVIKEKERKRSIVRKKAIIEFECNRSLEERQRSVWCKDVIDFNLCQHCAFLKILDYKEVNVQ